MSGTGYTELEAAEITEEIREEISDFTLLTLGTTAVAELLDVANPAVQLDARVLAPGGSVPRSMTVLVEYLTEPNAYRVTASYPDEQGNTVEHYRSGDLSVDEIDRTLAGLDRAIAAHQARAATATAR